MMNNFLHILEQHQSMKHNSTAYQNNDEIFLKCIAAITNNQFSSKLKILKGNAQKKRINIDATLKENEAKRVTIFDFVFTSQLKMKILFQDSVTEVI
ncbi:Hypothetical predicted protein [Octopus vulgaris]|uniref:Uncharacterized protein n=1 Tax=Octopus vulgaris TaxID=6645 RepID=A0AA36AP72_OCTVU|nr:Hypothetical predicted protein [Octopus vulgaris]